MKGLGNVLLEKVTRIGEGIPLASTTEALQNLELPSLPAPNQKNLNPLGRLAHNGLPSDGGHLQLGEGMVGGITDGCSRALLTLAAVGHCYVAGRAT